MENTKTNNVTADYLYNCRENFVIVALTGLSGSGCSEMAKMMADKQFYENTLYNIRKSNDVSFEPSKECTNTCIFESNTQSQSHASLKQLIFHREYTICYNFVQKHYKPYTIIKYNKVLWLETLLYIVRGDKSQPHHVQNGDELKVQIGVLLSKLYRPSSGKKTEDGSIVNEDDDYIKTYHDSYEGARARLDDFRSWDELYAQILKWPLLNNVTQKRSEEDKLTCYDLFFGQESQLEKFYRFFNETFSKLDYYCYCFFYHKLGFLVRATNNPFDDLDERFDDILDANENLFGVVKEINWLIKCLREHDKEIAKKEDRPFYARVCIDSLRNSIEAAFFKERYEAFYLVAVNDNDRMDHLFHKIENRVFGGVYMDEYKKAYLRAMQEKSEALCLTEAECSQYEHGQFAGANIAQCVMNAEIHLVQPQELMISKPADFYSVGEQWLKFAALIDHPGLISPSSEERCMEVAYTAKYNSGCLSRQVGAVITNKHHTIRSIGWNDVPYGQIPCSLREIADLISKTDESKLHKSYLDRMYSAFELSQRPYPKYKHLYKNMSFIQGLHVDYEQNIEACKCTLNGLPYPYCFKDEHNKMLCNSNQVFTRSLHAEENAMMQMVKYGGESLMDGIIYVTASPCELCSKKLYQLGVRKIVYIDPYPGIAREQIVACGFRRPDLQLFKGAYGATYCKLYQPIMAYKDELAIRLKEIKKK